MEPLETLTAEQYGTWLVKTIQETTNEETLKELNEHYETLVKELSDLERCFNLPPYEADRRL